MRCKSCDYLLWNIKARQCPECGTGFAPSQYEFLPNAVRYCCPHCEQSYYGTDVKGHLVPKEFNCVSCSRWLTMDEMLLRPAAGLTEEQTRLDRMPWLERQQRGWFKAWLATAWQSMIRPTLLIRVVPPQHPVVQAWAFACLTCLLILTGGIGIPLLFASLVMAINNDPDAIGMLISSVVAVIAGTIASLLYVVIWGLIAHGILLVTGGTEYPLPRTFHALLYSSGATLPQGVPCLGPYCGSIFGWIWWCISAILMLSHAQKVSGARATVAIIAFPGACFLLVVGMYAALILTLFAGVPGGFATVQQQQPPPSADLMLVTQRLREYALQRDGCGPDHALQLVNASFNAADFLATDSTFDPTSLRFAGTSLARMDDLNAGDRRHAADAAAQSMPDNVIAHRCGDFVFTYHGLNLADADPRLWIVVLAPVTADGSVKVQGLGLADGTSFPVKGDISLLLEEQNILRKALNLPPLPHPATVTHEAPAVGDLAPAQHKPATTNDEPDENSSSLAIPVMNRQGMLLACA